MENKDRKAMISEKLADFILKDILVPIEQSIPGGGILNSVSAYWTGHTVHDDWFTSAEESMSCREQIWDNYPYYREFTDMDRSHNGEVLLDYGCGPGSDLVWYTQKTNPAKIIGVDVSRSALENAQFRMALHGVDKAHCRLIQIEESKPQIPLEDESVDFISCLGVLMHTSYPDEILKEFCRVLKTGNGTDSKNNACIMVYNRESTWYHLYVAYYLRYVDSTNIGCSLDEAQKMEVDEIFRKSTDGIECPLARCWPPEGFVRMCKNAGFHKVEYQGGYPNKMELSIVRKYIADALTDERLEEEHKIFLRGVTFDTYGNPHSKGAKQCCLGGVYRLWK